MKTLVVTFSVLLMLTFLIGCGNINDVARMIDCTDGCSYETSADGAPGERGLPGVDGIDGTNGVDGIDGQDGLDGKDGEDLTPYVASSFVGNYKLINSGSINIIDAGFGRIAIKSSNIRTRNFDNGIAKHPTLPIGPHFVSDNKIIGLYSPSYSSSTNDVEHDNDQSTNITGNRDTLFDISFNNEEKLVIRIQVYVGNNLVVDRTVTEKWLIIKFITQLKSILFTQRDILKKAFHESWWYSIKMYKRHRIFFT